MALIAWSEGIALQHEGMDRTHAEFIEHLNALAERLEAGGDGLRGLDELIAHTEAHFGLEDAQMAALGYAPENCHTRQHAMVLELMREVRKHVTEKLDTDPLHRLMPALAEWFPQHVDAMDAPLAAALRSRTGGAACA
ncbi:MAG: hemerythrin domain-containing protein [Inhella sp.]|jgi:hemerythrin